VTGDVTGNLTGIPVTKKSEVKKTPPTPPPSRRVSDGDGTGRAAMKKTTTRTPHPYEDNVRRALQNGGMDSLLLLGMSEDEIIELCYDFAGPSGDPWYDGYLPMKDDVASLGTARNPAAVLRHRHRERMSA